MQQVERIRRMLYSLPESDQQLAEQFIQSRDFDSLKELVDSAISRIKRHRRGQNMKAEYEDIDLSEVSMLGAEVDLYLLRVAGSGGYYNPGEEDEED